MLPPQKKILVTGGAGFIGSNLIRLLIAQGHDVLNVDKLTYAGNLESLSDIDTSSRYLHAAVDIADGPAINQLFRDYQPSAVMHLAAESHVDRSIDGPDAFIRTNVLGTFQLLQAALEYWRGLATDPATANAPATPKKDFRFLHVSTDEVYGSLGPEGRFTETTRYDPHSPYSASKASSDHLARAWHDTYGLPVLVTNCSNNYGPYQFPEKLIPVVILKCLRGEPIPVYGKGENVRDWLYVEDHCQALVSVLNGGVIGETYNIGGDNELKNIDLVTMLCSLMDELSPETRPANSLSGHASLITLVADRPGHDMRYAINASKIRTQLGWQPLQNHQSGFRKTVQWYLDNRHWWQSILSGQYQLQRYGLNQPYQ